VIPRAHIVEWRATAPWITDAQVEQDLIIRRALVALFSNMFIAENLAFRGGTALHKLFLSPASRSSEDLDLVQVAAGPIGPIMSAVHEVLDNLLGTPRRDQSKGTTTFTYRTNSEIPPVTPMRLKVEINTREHFAIEGFCEHEFTVTSRWFSGTCSIKTYTIAELLGTKLRALYQRRKGRDLFDLWLGLTAGKGDPPTIVKVFKQYLAAEGLTISQVDFRKNLAVKMNHKGFLADTDSLIRTTIPYNPQEAHELIDQKLIQLL